MQPDGHEANHVTMCAVVFQMQPDGHEANHVTMCAVVLIMQADGHEANHVRYYVCCGISDAARWTRG